MKKETTHITFYLDKDKKIKLRERLKKKNTNLTRFFRDFVDKYLIAPNGKKLGRPKSMINHG